MLKLFGRKKNKEQEASASGTDKIEMKKPSEKEQKKVPLLLAGLFVGCLAGVYLGSSSPELFRALLGKEELVTKTEALAMEANARKQGASAVKKEKTVAAKGNPSAPMLMPPSASSVELGLSSKAGDALLPEKVELYDFSAGVNPENFGPTGKGVDVFLSFTCPHCFPAYATMNEIMEKDGTIPVRPVFLSRNDDDVRLFMTYSLLHSVSPEEGKRFADYVFSSWGKVPASRLIQGYAKINPAFSPDAMLGYWRNNRAALQTLVDSVATSAVERGVSQTPFFMVNGQPLNKDEGVSVEKIIEEWSKTR